MKATLTLPNGVATWLGSRPWLQIARAKKPSLRWGEWAMPLDLMRVAGEIDQDTMLRSIAERLDPGAPVPVVIGSYLRSDLRAELERAGASYIDGQGSLHISWRGGVIHIEGPRGRSAQPLGIETGLGVNGVRAIQALLAEQADIKLSRLAEVAQLSLSRTHALLERLEHEGLVRVTGQGPSTRRHVDDRSQLLDWLADQPSARRRERYLDVSLYARTPLAVWRLARARLDHAHIPHGLTGSAATALYEAGPTSVPISTIRVSPHVPLEEVGGAMDADVTPRGGNVRLVRDTGMVGSTGPIEHEGVLVAPLARVYLDTLSEKRGEDIARHFREVVLGY